MNYIYDGRLAPERALGLLGLRHACKISSRADPKVTDDPLQLHCFGTGQADDIPRETSQFGY